MRKSCSTNHKREGKQEHINGTSLLRRVGRKPEIRQRLIHFLKQMHTGAVSHNRTKSKLWQCSAGKIDRNKELLLADERAIIENIGVDRKDEIGRYLKDYKLEMGI